MRIEPDISGTRPRLSQKRRVKTLLSPDGTGFPEVTPVSTLGFYFFPPWWVEVGSTYFFPQLGKAYVDYAICPSVNIIIGIANCQEVLKTVSTYTIQ